MLTTQSVCMCNCSQVAAALLDDYTKVPIPTFSAAAAASSAEKQSSKEPVLKSLAYLRDRIGVPRDMSYPAARQLRAHLNWIMDHL